MFAEIRFEQFQQPVPVSVLFLAQLAKFGRLAGMILLKTIREILVNASVFLFQGNRQCEYFPPTKLSNVFIFFER